MHKARLGILLVLLVGVVAIDGTLVQAQGFGGAFGRRKIVLVRKLPPVGHIDGSAFTVNVTGPGIPGDVTAILKSTIESMIVSNDPHLRSVELGEHPDAIINCQISTFSEPPPVVTQETGLAFVKKGMPLQNQPMMHVTGLMAANFSAQDLRTKHSIAANTVMTKFEQEFAVPPPASTKPTLGGILAAHIPKMPTGSGSHASDDPSKAPTPAELRDWLIKSTAIDIASLLVNTSEEVSVELAVGGGLDEADRLMDQKLWTRALETLETMPPSGQPEQDAYRIYNLGVVNEALGYDAEDVTKARKYLQEASIDYGKAIDAKSSEKNFLQPQTRIDTALAHYKTLGDRATAAAQIASAAPAAPAAEALTNADVIAMVGAKLDEANILDTIKSASTVNFDLSAHGQIDLAKGKVSNNIITAMKAKARGK